MTYLETALGSALEWGTQLIIAFEIHYISEDTFKHLEIKIQSIQGVITRFMESLEKSPKSYILFALCQFRINYEDSVHC